jgi:hypothetical protein
VIVAIVAVAVAFVALVAILTMRASRRPARVPEPPAAGWTHAAGDDFTDLPEAARCDMVFAMAALDDDASRSVLERALDDPSETVALAAAHALANRGQGVLLERHFAANPGERATRIAETLALLHDPPVIP